MGTILLYGFEELNDILLIKAAVGPFGAEVKPVFRDGWRTPVGALAGRETRPAREGVFSGKLGGQMMVFCDLEQQLEGLLAALRQAGVGAGGYKAVLTKWNQEWDGIALFAELQRERREIEARKREQAEKK
ncbi:DUF3783 domain-containing protein [Oscillibacter sp.]|uniref:DUF3783 domain-containing protein n=1 Tax=Oscillibacter sp. TaxID=1945593 RepID=UPI0028A8191A|nr:DUF3783 domain-containing protein [Oscillibacter sp.]